MILCISIVYILLRITRNVRRCVNKRRRRRAEVDLSAIPRLEVTGPNRGWWRPRNRDSPSAPSASPSTPAEPSPCPSYASAITAPVISDRAITLLEELARSRENKMARILDSVPGRVQTVPPSPRSPPQDMEEVYLGLSAPAPSPPHVLPDQPAVPSPPIVQPPPEEEPMAHPSAEAVVQEAERQADAARANPTVASLARMRRLLHQ